MSYSSTSSHDCKNDATKSTVTPQGTAASIEGDPKHDSKLEPAQNVTRTQLPSPPNSGDDKQVADKKRKAIDDSSDDEEPPRKFSRKRNANPSESNSQLIGEKRKAVEDDSDTDPPRRKISKRRRTNLVATEPIHTPDPAEEPRRSTLNVSGKGVARKAGKKRAASTIQDKTNDRVKKSEKSESDLINRRKTLKGLINHKFACFSNVILQLIDAAIEENVLDALLGTIDGDLEHFGIDESNCMQFDYTKSAVSSKRTLKKKQDEIRAAIKAAAKASDTAKVSVTKHLRSVVANLRSNDTTDAWTSPYLFQSVLAFGAEEESSDRQLLSGDSQQDCFEYYQTVLNALVDDTHSKGAEGLKRLFEIETTTQDVCQYPGCEYKSSTRTSIENYHNIDVPKTCDNNADFQELVKASMRSDRDTRCAECSNASLVAETTFSRLPDNVVLRLNRNFFSHRGQQSKIQTLVDLSPSDPVQFGTTTYKVDAIIRHEGRQATHGHYNIFRRFEEEWYLLNDKECTKTSLADVRDHERGGKSVMVLLKKIGDVR